MLNKKEMERGKDGSSISGRSAEIEYVDKDKGLLKMRCSKYRDRHTPERLTNPGTILEARGETRV